MRKFHQHSASVADPDSFFTDPDPGIFCNPDPDPEAKTHFFKGNNKILAEIFIFNQKNRYFIFVFNQKSRYYCLVSFLKISENHEKLVEKVDFYSSISLPGSGSGFRIWIRIQPDDLNPHPPGSGTLRNELLDMIFKKCCINFL